MKIINPSAAITFLNKSDAAEDMKKIERAGRLCYRSDNLITEDSYEKFIKGIVKSGHESVIEHVNVTVNIVCSRATSHQIVRHRLASYSQESQRYVNYTKERHGEEIAYVFLGGERGVPESMLGFLEVLEKGYFQLITEGLKAEDARAILPNCTRTEMVMTANLREWRHFLNVRLGKGAQDEIKYIAQILLKQFYEYYPPIFEDIWEEYGEE